MRRLVELAYVTYGYSYAGVGWLARDLGISAETVAANYRKLEALKLIEIERIKGKIKKVYPLPRMKGSKKQRRQCWTDRALATPQLDLSYRLLWLLQEKSWQGGPVKLGQLEIAAALSTDQRHLHRAIAINAERQTLQVDSAGPGKANAYRLSGPFKMPPPPPPDDTPDPFDDSMSMVDYLDGIGLPDSKPSKGRKERR
jgi:hypothetical protein